MEWRESQLIHKIPHGSSFASNVGFNDFIITSDTNKIISIYSRLKNDDFGSTILQRGNAISMKKINEKNTFNSYMGKYWMKVQSIILPNGYSLDTSAPNVVRPRRMSMTQNASTIMIVAKNDSDPGKHHFLQYNKTSNFSWTLDGVAENDGSETPEIYFTANINSPRLFAVYTNTIKEFENGSLIIAVPTPPPGINIQGFNFSPSGERIVVFFKRDFTAAPLPDYYQVYAKVLGWIPFGRNIERKNLDNSTLAGITSQCCGFTIDDNSLILSGTGLIENNTGKGFFQTYTTTTHHSGWYTTNKIYNGENDSLSDAVIVSSLNGTRIAAYYPSMNKLKFFRYITTSLSWDIEGEILNVNIPSSERIHFSDDGMLIAIVESGGDHNLMSYQMVESAFPQEYNNRYEMITNRDELLLGLTAGSLYGDNIVMNSFGTRFAVASRLDKNKGEVRVYETFCPTLTSETNFDFKNVRQIGQTLQVLPEYASDSLFGSYMSMDNTGNRLGISSAEGGCSVYKYNSSINLWESELALADTTGPGNSRVKKPLHVFVSEKEMIIVTIGSNRGFQIATNNGIATILDVVTLVPGPSFGRSVAVTTDFEYLLISDTSEENSLTSNKIYLLRSVKANYVIQSWELVSTFSPVQGILTSSDTHVSLAITSIKDKNSDVLCRIVIGSPNYDASSTVQNSGRILVCDYHSNNTWTTEMNYSGVVQDENIGLSVGIDGRGVTVSGSSTGNKFSFTDGKIYNFCKNSDTGVWLEMGAPISALSQGENFGRNLALSKDGGILLASSHRYGEIYHEQGAVQMYGIKNFVKSKISIDKIPDISSDSSSFCTVLNNKSFYVRQKKGNWIDNVFYLNNSFPLMTNPLSNAKIYVAETTPQNIFGNVGDIYYNIYAGILFIKEISKWIRYYDIPAPAYRMTGIPDDDVGISGSYYVDPTNRTLVGPKYNNSWKKCKPIYLHENINISAGIYVFNSNLPNFVLGMHGIQRGYTFINTSSSIFSKASIIVNNSLVHVADIYVPAYTGKAIAPDINLGVVGSYYYSTTTKKLWGQKIYDGWDTYSVKIYLHEIKINNLKIYINDKPYDSTNFSQRLRNYNDFFYIDTNKQTIHNNLFPANKIAKYATPVWVRGDNVELYNAVRARSYRNEKFFYNPEDRSIYTSDTSNSSNLLYILLKNIDISRDKTLYIGQHDPNILIGSPGDLYLHTVIDEIITNSELLKLANSKALLVPRFAKTGNTPPTSSEKASMFIGGYYFNLNDKTLYGPKDANDNLPLVSNLPIISGTVSTIIASKYYPQDDFGVEGSYYYHLKTSTQIDLYGPKTFGVWIPTSPFKAIVLDTFVQTVEYKMGDYVFSINTGKLYGPFNNTPIEIPHIQTYSHLSYIVQGDENFFITYNTPNLANYSIGDIFFVQSEKKLYKIGENGNPTPPTILVEIYSAKYAIPLNTSESNSYNFDRYVIREEDGVLLGPRNLSETINTAFGPETIMSRETIMTLPYTCDFTTNSIMVGNGLPPGELGDIGEYYINLSTKILYGPKYGETIWTETPNAYKLRRYNNMETLVGMSKSNATIGETPTEKIFGGDYLMDLQFGNIYGPYQYPGIIDIKFVREAPSTIIEYLTVNPSGTIYICKDDSFRATSELPNGLVCFDSGNGFTFKYHVTGIVPVPSQITKWIEKSRIYHAEAYTVETPPLPTGPVVTPVESVNKKSYKGEKTTIKITANGLFMAIGTRQGDGMKGNVKIYQRDILTDRWFKVGDTIESARVVNIAFDNIDAISRFFNEGNFDNVKRAFGFEDVSDELDFAEDIAISGTTLENLIIAIGAPSSYDNKCGYVRCIKNINGKWVDDSKFRGSKAIASLGTSIALSANGSRMVLSEPGPFYSTVVGKLRIYDRVDGKWVGQKRHFIDIVGFAKNALILLVSGMVAGALIGSTIGSIVGQVIPVVGPIVGTVLGLAIGVMAGYWIATRIIIPLNYIVKGLQLAGNKVKTAATSILNFFSNPPCINLFWISCPPTPPPTVTPIEIPAPEPDQWYTIEGSGMLHYSGSNMEISDDGFRIVMSNIRRPDEIPEDLYVNSSMDNMKDGFKKIADAYEYYLYFTLSTTKHSMIHIFKEGVAEINIPTAINEVKGIGKKQAITAGVNKFADWINPEAALVLAETNKAEALLRSYNYPDLWNKWSDAIEAWKDSKIAALEAKYEIVKSKAVGKLLSLIKGPKVPNPNPGAFSKGVTLITTKISNTVVNPVLNVVSKVKVAFSSTKFFSKLTMVLKLIKKANIASKLKHLSKLRYGLKMFDIIGVLLLIPDVFNSMVSVINTIDWVFKKLAKDVPSSIEIYTFIPTENITVAPNTQIPGEWSLDVMQAEPGITVKSTVIPGNSSDTYGTSMTLSRDGKYLAIYDIIETPDPTDINTDAKIQRMKIDILYLENLGSTAEGVSKTVWKHYSQIIRNFNANGSVSSNLDPKLVFNNDGSMLLVGDIDHDSYKDVYAGRIETYTKRISGTDVFYDLVDTLEGNYTGASISECRFIENNKIAYVNNSGIDPDINPTMISVSEYLI